MEENYQNTNGNIHEPQHKKIVVISGDGDLNISDVKDHLNIEEPTSRDSNKKIVIPPDQSKKQ